MIGYLNRSISPYVKVSPVTLSNRVTLYSNASHTKLIWLANMLEWPHQLEQTMNMKTATSLTFLLAVGFTGCEDDPCAKYVEYMCDCHEDDPNAECSDLQTIYSDANADLMDECAIELDDQQQEDSESGLECQQESGDTGA